MSMKDYDFTLSVNKSIEIAAQGRYVYYLKGSTPQIDAGVGISVAGNQAIRVRANSTSIVLMPGQSFRLPPEEKQPSAWRVENQPNAETITGTILVGEGDFRDSNTSNTSYVKLDAAFANNVTVMNDVEHRVPVTLDPTQTLNVADDTVNYNTSFADASIATAVIPVLAPANNPNGCYVEYAEFAATTGTASGTISLLAKAGAAPANSVDGDVLLYCSIPASSSHEKWLQKRIKVPAGKGLYIHQGGGGNGLSTAAKTVLLNVL